MVACFGRTRELAEQAACGAERDLSRRLVSLNLYAGNLEPTNDLGKEPRLSETRLRDDDGRGRAAGGNLATERAERLNLREPADEDTFRTAQEQSLIHSASSNESMRFRLR